MMTAKALERAQNLGLDLVEVAPMAKPPVCKIMDYGKHKYEQSRKKQEQKKKQNIVHLKEIRFRPQTDIHDLEFKVKNMVKFLESGDKVKVSVFFRGREMAFKDKGRALLDKVIDLVGDKGVVESVPKMEGRSMGMILIPSSLAPKKLKQQMKEMQNAKT